MAFKLPDLPYPANALEPHIDQRTMEIHHGKHHAAYVSNLNNALQGTGLEDKSLTDLLANNLAIVPEKIRTAVRNNGGGHFNHSFFWPLMTSNPSDPPGDVVSAINGAFGSMDNFKEKFQAAAMGRFGSGWAWLVKDGHSLAITSTPNQDSPVMEGKTPLLGLDVWEHAYYLHYQNRRADYIKAWWNVVNWERVGRRLSG